MSTFFTIVLVILGIIGAIAAAIGIGVLVLFGLSLYHMAKVMQNRGL